MVGFCKSGHIYGVITIYCYTAAAVVSTESVKHLTIYNTLHHNSGIAKVGHTGAHALPT